MQHWPQKMTSPRNNGSRRNLLCAGAMTFFTARASAAEFTRRGVVAQAAQEPDSGQAQIPSLPSRIINICDPPYNADPTGQTNCAGIIQTVFNDLQSAGSGVVIVPAGDFRMDFPVISSNGSITILGAGPNLSVLLVQHDGVAIALNTYNTYDSFIVRDIGFSPIRTGGTTAGIALSLNYPNSNVGWVRADVSNICIGVPKPNYTTFEIGLRLENCRRGTFREINYHSNIGPVAGTTGIFFTGFCVDNHFDSCFLEDVDLAINISSYCEGINLSGSVLIGNRGIATGTAPYNGSINVLGLYIWDCEFNCNDTSANLFQVTGGGISETHLSTQTPNLPAISMVGCNIVPIINCSITGEFNASFPSYYTGIYVAKSAGCQIDNCTCTNLLVGLIFDAGTLACSATGLRMLAPGLTALVNNGLTYGQYEMLPAIDNSQNTSNFVEWIASSGRKTQRSRHRICMENSENIDLAAGLH